MRTWTQRNQPGMRGLGVVTLIVDGGMVLAGVRLALDWNPLGLLLFVLGALGFAVGLFLVGARTVVEAEPGRVVRHKGMFWVLTQHEARESPTHLAVESFYFRVSGPEAPSGKVVESQVVVVDGLLLRKEHDPEAAFAFAREVGEVLGLEVHDERVDFEEYKRRGGQDVVGSANA